jgi:hypothetical protein
LFYTSKSPIGAPGAATLLSQLLMEWLLLFMGLLLPLLQLEQHESRGLV